MIPIWIKHHQSKIMKMKKKKVKHPILIYFTLETIFPMEYSIRSTRRAAIANSSYVIQFAFSFPPGPFA
jgi:hypothetical protein